MKLYFLGGAREVGRSSILVETQNNSRTKRVLLDCGIKLEEDEEEHPLLEEKQMRSLDAVALTHAHLDHSGFLPALYEAGFRGKTFLTKPTRDLIQVLLADYLRINQHASPYGQEDVKMLLANTEILEAGGQPASTRAREQQKETSREPQTRSRRKHRSQHQSRKDYEIAFHDAGHIVGSAMIEIRANGKKLLYTGDLNTRATRLLEGAKSNLLADALIIESTYGSKADKHPSLKESGRILSESIKETFNKGGKVIIPTFGIGRGQEILFTLENFMRSGAIPEAPIYIDGMIKKVLRIYRHNAIYLKREVQHRILTSEDDPFKSKFYYYPETRDRSDVLAQDKAIIVTTSGMLNGGPVLTYLKHLGADPKNKIIFVGYQAKGTRGRELLDGAKELKFDDEVFPMNLEVVQAPISAHSDFNELMAFVKSIQGLKKVFVVHGEGTKPFELAEAIEEWAASQKKQVEVFVPSLGKEYRV